MTERSIDKHGQALLIPEIELDGWWTNLDNPKSDIIKLYTDHGTSEQYHSEFKTDLDVEQLPSGKFATNALILACSVLVYDILRWIGQNGLLKAGLSRRQGVKRRRIKTVMQKLMYVAAEYVRASIVFSCPLARAAKPLKLWLDCISDWLMVEVQ